MYLCGRNACNNEFTDGFGAFGSIRLARCVVEDIQNAERSAGGAAEERRALHRSIGPRRQVDCHQKTLHIGLSTYAALQQRLQWFFEYNCHQRPKQPLRNCWSRRVSIEGSLIGRAGTPGCPRSRSGLWTDCAGARRHGRDTSAASAALQAPEWHAVPTESVLSKLETDAEGLASSEARRRLDRCGPNLLRPPKRRGPLMRLLLQFHNILIYVLLASAAVTATMQHWVDTAVIVGVVVINAFIGFLQEGKAEKALDAIRKMLSLQANALRDGRRQAVSAETLVPGDMIFIESGDKVPADLRLLEVKNLQVQEAALTGESVAVEKAPAPVDAGAALGDRTCMAYAGTLVASGRGKGVVVATGDASEIGRISAMLSEVSTLTTPLLQQVARFSRWLTALILGSPPSSSLRRACLPVHHGGDVPGRGRPRGGGDPGGFAGDHDDHARHRRATDGLAQRHHPSAAGGRNAGLGQLHLLGQDRHAHPERDDGGEHRHSHTVHRGLRRRLRPARQFLHDGREIVDIERREVLCEMVRGAMLCSDATLRQSEDGWLVDGDPTEGALVVVSVKAGLDPDFERKAYPRTDVIPFESEHRFMATLHHDHAGRGFIYVKGAPERILEMCRLQRGTDGDQPLDADFWWRHIDDIGGRGQRVLAQASKSTISQHRELHFDDVASGLTLLGLFGLADPPPR